MFPLTYFCFDFQKLAVLKARQSLFSRGFVPKRPIWISHQSNFAFLLYCRTGLCDHIIETKKKLVVLKGCFQMDLFQNSQYGFVTSSILHFFVSCVKSAIFIFYMVVMMMMMMTARSKALRHPPKFTLSAIHRGPA